MAMYFQDGIAIMGSQAKIPKSPVLGCLEDSIIEGRMPEGSFLEVSAHPHPQRMALDGDLEQKLCSQHPLLCSSSTKWPPLPPACKAAALYHDFACAGFFPLQSYKTQFQHHLFYEAQIVTLFPTNFSSYSFPWWWASWKQEDLLILFILHFCCLTNPDSRWVPDTSLWNKEVSVKSKKGGIRKLSVSQC